MNLGVVNRDNAVIGRVGMKTEADRGREAVIDRIIEAVRSACDDAGVDLNDISAVGLAAPGAIDIPRGVVLEAPNLRWRDVPLRDLLEQKLDRPVVVDNDVNAAIWGEFVLGAAQPYPDCLGVWVGTGVGGGLVLDGKLHHGSHYTAGEIGHTIIRPDQPRGRRTVEDLCSRTGMSRLVQQRVDEYPGSGLLDEQGNAPSVTPAWKLAEAWNDGDELAGELVQQAADLLGVAMANAVTLLSIGAVVVGGGVTEALGERFLRMVRSSFDENVFPDSARQCVMVMTQLKAESGLLGAALLARAQHEQQA